MSDQEYILPAPHVYEDGSVRETAVHYTEGATRITIRDGDYFIIIDDPAHARAVAHALSVAADLMEAH